jgi:hypothetical protein
MVVMKANAKIILTQLFFSLSVLLNPLSLMGQNEKLPVSLNHDASARRVEVTIGGKFFTSFLYDAMLEKPVLFPINASEGTTITRGFPLEPRAGERIDHPHHIGSWFNYGSVNGLDFWNNSSSIPKDQKHLYGTVRHERVVVAESGNTSGRLVVQSQWVDVNEKVLLTEETEFIFSGTETLRTIDRKTKLIAGSVPVVFKDNKEGMMAIRMDRAFEAPVTTPEVFVDANGKPTTVPVMNNEGKNGVYQNSHGETGAGVWGKRADWMTLTAKLGSGVITVAMLDHKRNFGYPAHWHARTYGLFSVNNFGSKVYVASDPEQQFDLMPEKSVEFRHRIIIFSGMMPDGFMSEQFADFNR